jgi:hypothetical protein
MWGTVWQASIATQRIASIFVTDYTTLVLCVKDYLKVARNDALGLVECV